MKEEKLIAVNNYCKTNHIINSNSKKSIYQKTQNILMNANTSLESKKYFSHEKLLY